jgi:hydrogenase-4 component B
MPLLATSLTVLFFGAILSAAPFRTCRSFGPILAALGSLLAFSSVFTGGSYSSDLTIPWPLPFGAFHIGFDALSRFFVLPIAGVSFLGAVYGHGYLKSHGSPRAIGASWAFYNVLTAAMLVVVTARNGMLFLIAWETMSLASFFLVLFEHRKQSVARAGWVYLVATHAGTACLLVAFLLLDTTGTMEFSGFAAGGMMAGFVFAAALVGFGTKAGFVPLHVWLPEAHPAAPAHVSAVMSGVMIKTGIYGILRVSMFLGPPQAWWGWALVVAGLSSGVIGALYALAQSDMKRLLAYCSVENVGIIALGMGLGFLGLHASCPAMAFLGFSGALLHVLNHAIFKSLLFFGAGAVLHEAGTIRIDQLGGLMKRMPRTGSLFLVGSAAISGLPPFNGFASEFLIYIASFQGILAGNVWGAGILGLVGLALIGGLATAGFVKVLGAAFLGEPRSDGASRAHDPSPILWGPMAILAVLCLIIGLTAPIVLRVTTPVANDLMGFAASDAHILPAETMLTKISGIAAILLAVILALVGLRAWLFSGRSHRRTVTWDCGYTTPSPRIQYTGSSFVNPILRMFWLLSPEKTEMDAPDGEFPARSRFVVRLADPFLEACRLGYRVVAFLGNALGRLQQGNTHGYILYIVVTLLILLVWKLR